MSMQVTRDDVRFDVYTERCCGCRHCIRTCMEDVWRWDDEKNCAIPKYPDECVKCYQCEMVCRGNCFEIVPITVMNTDPLKNQR